VWKEEKDRWAGSRPVWNQHNYFVTNVRDDGTIPPMTQVQSHWEGGPNTFRENVQGTTGKSLSLADVTTAGASSFECNPTLGMATVHVDLCNRGAAPVPAQGAEIALVDDQRPTSVLCRQRNAAEIPIAKCVEVACDIPAPPRSSPMDLRILGDATDEVDECNENNNVSIIARVSCGGDGPN
jgi:hypothetical protein